MATCCCYRKYDGSDAGCTTVAGNTCPSIPGYTLISSTPGACLTNSLQAIVADAEKTLDGGQGSHSQQAVIQLRSGKRITVSVTEGAGGEIAITYYETPKG